QVLKMIFHSATQKEADILGLTSNHHSNDRKLLESWQQWQQQNPVSKASAKNQFLAATKFSITDKPQQPLLFVTSRADRLVDYRCSLKLAETWQTSYMQHETAGHDLPLDEPEWLAGIIRQWFDSMIMLRSL
ncbi:MAG: alpha/beta hydrolase, partial [Nitrosomonas sp.]|uniref:alpha/beta fold hydrolase n=1 Tax=Nitrosomonas sp. TaxID=42353 RepID=UPI002743A1BC|nr:alpha/beta hydrolase [Nitrosomonas sp.]